jgi:alkyl hydroperoxide reductase subunit F
MFDLIIIGGGPAGVSAGIYAARKKMKTLLITDSFGGQSVVSSDIRNWIGTLSMAGLNFATALEAHLRAQEDIEIKTPETVAAVKAFSGGFEVLTDKGNTYQSKTLIVASGGRRRRLNIPGEDKFAGKGVAYCATCDAPLFRSKVVTVVGGGNAGLEAVVDLLPYAAKIYLLEHGRALTGDPLTQLEVRRSPLVTIITHAKAVEITGDEQVVGLKYLDGITKKEKLLEVNGVFVEIGSLPNSEMVKGLVETNKYGEILIDHKNCATSKPGIWAAGDVTDIPFKQNNISAGDGVKAALAAYAYLLEEQKQAPGRA